MNAYCDDILLEIELDLSFCPSLISCGILKSEIVKERCILSDE